jgi:hypothetical protein
MSTLAELRGISDEELVARHDQVATHLDPSVNYYLAELARRDQDRQTQAMLGYTRWITVMTAVMTVATIVNVIVAALLLCQSRP